MEKLYCGSVEEIVENFVQIFEYNDEVKAIVNLEVAEELSKIYSSIDFEGYFSTDIKSDVQLYIVEKLEDTFVIEPLWRYDSETGRYIVESEITETSVIAVDMEELSAKELEQFIDAEEVYQVIYEDCDNEDEFVCCDGDCENCEESDYEEDDEELEEIDLDEVIEDCVEAIQNGICEDCTRELIDYLLEIGYAMGYQDAEDDNDEYPED